MPASARERTDRDPEPVIVARHRAMLIERMPPDK